MRFQSIAAILAVAPLLVAADQPVRLQPASKWVLHYAENSCRLQRRFGDSANPTLLLLERASPQSGLSMVVIGKALNPPADKEVVTARFVPGESLNFKDGQIAKSASTKEPAAIWSRVGFHPVLDGTQITAEMTKAMEAWKSGQRPEPRDLERIASARAEGAANATKVTQIEILVRDDQPLVLETGSLGNPIKMLEDCTRQQLKTWGIDADLEDRIARPVWAPAAYKWFSADDYPQSSAMKGEQSLVEVRLLVDAQGKVTNCTALSHFRAPEFQKKVCKVLTRRAKYHPAELADGTKVPSYTTLAIRFQIPH